MTRPTRRKFDADERAHIKKLATTVGEVILAMNRLQAVMFWIFYKLMDPSPEHDAPKLSEGGRYLPVDQALAVWNIVSSDATQRDMMLAAAEAWWLASPKNRMLASIRWLKLKADSLGRIRNDAAHVVVVYGWENGESEDKGKLSASWYPMPASRLKRFEEVKEIGDRFRHVVGDINQLRGYAWGIADQLSALPGSLPKRPKLRAVPNQK